MTPLIAVSAAFVLCLLWALLTYNRLVHAHAKVGEALSGIDVQLRLRHDLVPRLVNVVGGYARHERSLLQRATEIRAEAAKTDSAAIGGLLENQLASTLSSVTALGEAYPGLAASQNFLALAKELSQVENEIQSASAIYNSNVRIYNSLLQSIPTAWVARAMRFESASFVRLNAAELLNRELAAA